MFIENRSTLYKSWKSFLMENRTKQTFRKIPLMVFHFPWIYVSVSNSNSRDHNVYFYGF